MKECNQYDNWCEKEKRTCNNCYYERSYNMSDEEKKAIEWLKKADWFSARLYAPTILNLIEKQSKEIEDRAKICKNIQKFINKDYVEQEYISKDKIKAKIEEFKRVRDEILREEKEFNRPMMTYDLKRNDYCEKMLQSLLDEEE